MNINEKNNVLLIGGYKSAGKTSLADMLIASLKVEGITVNKLSFATPFKRLLVDGGILTQSQVTGTQDEKNIPSKVQAKSLFKELREKYQWYDDYYLSAREIMQILGNDILKVLSPTIWVDYAINTIKKSPGYDLHIIDDYRFGGVEDQMPFKMGSIYIEDINLIKKDNHSSENSLNASQVDLVIHTDKTKRDNLTTNTAIAREYINKTFGL